MSSGKLVVGIYSSRDERNMNKLSMGRLANINPLHGLKFYYCNAANVWRYITENSRPNIDGFFGRDSPHIYRILERREQDNEY